MSGMKQNPLRVWRDDHKLSQKHAAKLIGVPPMTLSRWERGDHFPHKKHWQLIEDATGIAPSVLVEHVKIGGDQ
jgi:transcriptional regulator with XRE-family HTH domain